MRAEVVEEVDEVLPPKPKGELVHWMAPRPWSVGRTGLALAVVGAFALGVLCVLMALGLPRRAARR